MVRREEGGGEGVDVCVSAWGELSHTHGRMDAHTHAHTHANTHALTWRLAARAHTHTNCLRWRRAAVEAPASAEHEDFPSARGVVK